MEFGSSEVGCWGGDWPIKCKFVSSQCESHYMHIFLLGPNVADNTTICDLGALGDFMPVDEKIIVSTLYVFQSL